MAKVSNSALVRLEKYMLKPRTKTAAAKRFTYQVMMYERCSFLMYIRVCPASG